MSLTTPVIRDEDSVFPGENWFLYWKTSASLWKTKIESRNDLGTILVPINWSFHSDTGDSYDFAVEKPETDLNKLVKIVEDCGKKIILLVPISPCPFLPNGGVPSLIARNTLIDAKGKIKSFLDQDGFLNRMYSFFDPRVYRAYGKFTRALGNYITQSGISCDVYGLDCGQITADGFLSTFEDFSEAFNSGFSRFVEAKQEEFNNTSQIVMTPEKEYLLKYEFTEMIKGIYFDSCYEGLSGNWEGVVRGGMIGGSNEDFFKRLNNKDSHSQYAHDILESVSLDVLPSSILLPTRLKKGILGKMFQNLVLYSFAENLFSENSFEDDNSAQFRPKRFFEVYDITPDIPPDTVGWADLGLWDYLQENFSWCFSDKGEQQFQWSEESDMDKVYFFHGITMNQRLFHNILKTFMGGGKVILNRSGLAPEFQKKLEAFFIENEITVEKVKFVTNIYNASLGEGRLLILDGDVLVDLEHKKLEDFWGKVIGSFETNHILVTPPNGIQVSWRSRSCTKSELNFEEMRRMDIFNPSSYKKKFSYPIPGNFKLIKVLDEDKVEFFHGQKEIEIVLLPEGSVSLDFGVFS